MEIKWTYTIHIQHTYLHWQGPSAVAAVRWKGNWQQQQQKTLGGCRRASTIAAKYEYALWMRYVRMIHINCDAEIFRMCTAEEHLPVQFQFIHIYSLADSLIRYTMSMWCISSPYKFHITRHRKHRRRLRELIWNFVEFMAAMMSRTEASEYSLKYILKHSFMIMNINFSCCDTTMKSFWRR